MTETATATAEAPTPHERAPLPTRFVVIASTIMLGWAAAHGAIVGALVAGLVPGGWWTVLAAFVLVIALPLFAFMRGLATRAYPSAFSRVYVMRPFWYAQLSLPFLSTAGALAFLVGLPFGAGLAFARVALAVVALLLLALFVGGYFGSRALVVRHHAIELPDVPEAFDGVTVAQLSDLHVGPHTSAAFLDRAVAAVRAAKPDLIAYTGDQVDDYDADVARFAQVFGPLRAPLGVYAIAGNHDVYAGWPAVRAGMEAAGMRVLVNDAEPVKRGGSELWIVGTGDPAGAQGYGEAASEAAPNLERAMSRVPPGAFSLVLAHNPALWPALAKLGARVTLSGHTHHGQFSVPAWNWSLATPFLEHAMGHYADGSSRLYIHPGTNYWGLPFRIGAWPEVAIVTLRRARAVTAPSSPETDPR